MHRYKAVMYAVKFCNGYISVKNDQSSGKTFKTHAKTMHIQNAVLASPDSLISINNYVCYLV